MDRPGGGEATPLPRSVYHGALRAPGPRGRGAFHNLEIAHRRLEGAPPNLGGAVSATPPGRAAAGG